MHVNKEQMPYYYFDGKKVEYFVIVDGNTGDIQGLKEKNIQGFSEIVTHQGTNTVLGEVYPDVSLVKARIMEEWDKYFSNDDPDNDKKRDSFWQNLNTELDGLKLQDIAHHPFEFNEIMGANKLLKHMLEYINEASYSEGVKRIADRQITDTLSGGVNTDHDHSGYRWFRHRSMRDGSIPIPLTAEEEDAAQAEAEDNLPEPSDEAMAALNFFP